jgi:hypothetical protein
MTNDELVKKVNELLDTDSDLDFFAGLKEKGPGKPCGMYQRKVGSGE